MEKALQLNQAMNGEGGDKNWVAEKVVITRPPTPQTSTTGQLFTFFGQTRNVKKSTSPSLTGVYLVRLFVALAEIT